MYVIESADICFRVDFMLTFAKVIHKAAPRLGWLIFIMVGVQVTLFGLYALYKKRMNSGPKKYL